ncbi:DUF4357 domain-containing protein [Streptomyces sp. NPDC046215]
MLSIHFDSAVIAHLANAGSDETIHVTLAPGIGAAATTPPPVVPRGALTGLLQAGLLAPGAVLTFHRYWANRFGRAVVTPDGQFAEAATGNVINSWTLWHLSDGRTLDDLRRELALDSSFGGYTPA